jgi:MoaA/NifB/PqqE/SkfB family radical SAM enzyme
MNLDQRFKLDVFRSADERIEMINHDECPIEVKRIVAEWDLDQDVLFALWLQKLDDKIVNDFLKDRLEFTEDELIKKQYDHTLTKDLRYKVFCSLPWNHVSTNADGSFRMCCQMIHNHADYPYGSLFKENGEVLTQSDDISQHRNALAWKEIRKQMMEGTDPEICRLCTHEEQNGIGSKRQWSRQKYPELFSKAIEMTQPDGSINNEDFPITYYDLRFGNKCNLQCRTCGPTDSDLWYGNWFKEHPDGKFNYRGHDVLQIVENDQGIYKIKGDVFNWPEKQNPLWDKITTDLPNIDRFYFTGGEPTVNVKHRTLLQECIDRNLAKNISLEYNSNMAGVPSKVFEQWKHFRRVGVGMSIDGIYEHFEYIRNPGKWKTVEKNLRRIDSEEGFDRVDAGITLTLSTMNVLHVLDMLWWHREQDFKRINPAMVIHNLYGPDHFNIQNLPHEAKLYVKERYQKFMIDYKNRWSENELQTGHTHIVMQRLNAVLDHMFAQEQNEAHWNNLFTEFSRYDKHRKENWKETFPEIVEMLRIINDRKTRKQKVKLTTAGKK